MKAARRRPRGTDPIVQQRNARIVADLLGGKSTIKGAASAERVSPTTARKVINSVGVRMRFVTDLEFSALLGLRAACRRGEFEKRRPTK